ncbi:MAG: 3-dehydroquinate synthase [Marinilabiliales bacterium]|nr:MAG: 3-dehydroquinate synthase [Marinilabiliales bacterium]
MKINENTLLQTGSDAKLFHNLIKDRKAIIVSDGNVFNLYPELFFGYEHVLIGQGEDIKTLSTVEYLINEFTAKNLDRNSLIIGLGGGLITDVVGFVASIFMRGVNFGFIPTTLLAQVDAAIGGKNGVNFNLYKNYIGTFNQPEFIICDSIFFKTLPEIEFKSGLGEVLKYSLIQHTRLFDYLNNNTYKVLNRDTDALNYIVNECIEIKTAVVEQDPFDHGIRNILNLGHSFGHVIELTENIPHGIAVVAGIKKAAELSSKLGHLDKDTLHKIENLANKLGFSNNYEFKKEHVEILLKDKKKTNDILKLVILKDIGFADTIELDEQQIKDLL